MPLACGSTLWPYSASGSQPRPGAGGPPRLRCTPQLETSNGSDGFVTSISRKSPLPRWSRRPLGEPASAYSLVGTLAYTKLRLEVGAVLDLELVQAARAAAGAQQPELDRLRRVGDVEDLQAAEEARVGAGAAADLDAGDGDVAPRARAVGRGVDDDVLDRGAGRVLQLGDHARLGRVARVEHGDAALSGAGQKRCLEPDA